MCACYKIVYPNLMSVFESRESMKIKLFEKKKGAALPVTIIAVVIIMLFSAVLLSVQWSEVKLRKVTEDRMKAKYIAEGGLEAAISAMVKSMQQGLDITPVSSNDVVIPIKVNTSTMNGQQYSVTKNKEGAALDNIVFKVIANGDGTYSYSSDSSDNNKSLEVYSLGKLYDSNGRLIRTYGLSASVNFVLDIGKDAIISYDVVKLEEK